MSLNTRDFTQGGQVLKYMIGMFLQIMNIATFWILMASLAVFALWVGLSMRFEQIIHGGSYWLVKWVVLPFRQQFPSGAGNTMTFHWTRPQTGQVVEFKFTAAQVVADRYFQQQGNLLKEVAFWGWGAASVTFALGFLAVFWYLGRSGRRQRENVIVGGRELVDDVKVVNKILKKHDRLSPLSLCGLHMVRYSEMQNIGMHGTVGSGKSTMIINICRQLRAEGHKVMIYDKGGNFLPLFYRPNKDVILNPFDARCAAWDLWDECRTVADFENFAKTLLPDAPSGDPFWLLAARRLFADVARRLAKMNERNLRTLMKKLLSVTLADLRGFLKDTDSANLVDGSVEKTAMTIRMVLTSYVTALRFLQGLDEEGKRPFNLRDWVHTEDMNGDNSWIFITSDGRHHEALKPLLTAWLHMLMVNVLGLRPDNGDRERRIWLLLDELPSLHKLPILKDYIAEARKFGGCTLIGLQNYPQLEAQFGREGAADIWDLLNTRVFGRAPSAHVAKFVQEELGEKRHLKFRDQYSYGVDIIRDGVQFSKDEVSEHLVSYSDVQNLDDLECYVALAGRLPVVKMKMKREKYAVVAEATVSRDVDAVLDEDIESLIEAGVDDAQGLATSALDALFDERPVIAGEQVSPAAAAQATEAEDEAEGRGTDIAPPTPAAAQAATPQPEKTGAGSKNAAMPPELADEDQMVRPTEKATFTEMER
ncbi:conjugal transfer protein TraD (plasmid) [Serratia marcescens]|nr:conjugal transfer protein TraD [Serratia marcescens]